MITKAQILSIDYIANTCKLRMPLFENVNNDNVIADATFSIAPGVFNNYAVGDMVYVAFENDIWHEPVVIGKLYLGANKEANINQGAVYASDLNISSSAILPASTKIKFAADTKLTGNLDKYTSLADMANSIQKLEKTCSVVSFDDVAQNEQQKTDLAEYITINGVRKKIATTMSDLPDFSAYDRKIQEDFKAADDKLNWEIEKVGYQINELDEEQHTITTRIDSVETATDNKLGELKKETDTALQIAIGEIHSWVDEQIKDADGHIIKELRTDIEQNSRAIDLVAQEQTKDAYNIAKLEVTANQISSSVSSLSSDLALTKSSIEQTADQIKMEVSSGYVKNNDFNIEDTFGWNMTTGGVNFYDESKDVLKIDETGIKVAGTIEAESGHIGVTYDSIKTIEYKDFFYDSEIWTFDNIAETTENSTTTYQLLYKSNSTNPQYVLLVNGLPNLVDRESFPCEIYLASDETFQNKILDINISLDEIINEGYYTEHDGTPSDPSDPGYYYKITVTDDAIKKELVTNKIIPVVYNGDDDEWQWNTHNRTYTVEQPEAADEDTTLVFYNNDVEFEVNYNDNLPSDPADDLTVYLFYEERWAKGAVDNGYQQYICDNDEYRIIQFTKNDINNSESYPTYQIKATENIINCNSFSIKRYKIAKVSLEPSDPTAGFTIGTNSIYNGMTSLADSTQDGIYLGTDGIALGKGKFNVDKSGTLMTDNGYFGSSKQFISFTMNSQISINDQTFEASKYEFIDNNTKCISYWKRRAMDIYIWAIVTTTPDGVIYNTSSYEEYYTNTNGVYIYSDTGNLATESLGTFNITSGISISNSIHITNGYISQTISDNENFKLSTNGLSLNNGRLLFDNTSNQLVISGPDTVFDHTNIQNNLNNYIYNEIYLAIPEMGICKCVLNPSSSYSTTDTIYLWYTIYDPETGTATFRRLDIYLYLNDYLANDMSITSNYLKVNPKYEGSTFAPPWDIAPANVFRQHLPLTTNAQTNNRIALTNNSFDFGLVRFKSTSIQLKLSKIGSSWALSPSGEWKSLSWVDIYTAIKGSPTN